MSKQIILLTLLVLFTIPIHAQKSPLKFGSIDANNLQQTVSLIDSTAGAEYIMDYGVVSFDHNFEVKLTTHVRLKIFNKSAFDLANIEIPYDASDRVDKLKAATYNWVNGEVVSSDLSKKDIYTEEVTDGLKQKKFSLPDVQAGSIIEYTYSVNYGSWRSLPVWYFQNSVPVRHSEYVVSLPEYFQYRQIMTGYVALSDFEEYRENGSYQGQNLTMNVKRFVAKDVPAFKEEPYMTAEDNYISKVEFALARIDIPGEVNKQYMPNSYQQLSKAWSEQPEFSSQITHTRFLRDKVETLTAPANSDLEKAQHIYYFVTDSIEYDEASKDPSLRTVFRRRTGNGFQINRLLAAMLYQAGFKPEFVRLSTRANGYLHPSFPIQSKFNYTLVLVTLDDQPYLMDVEKNLPFGMIPDYCLNGEGMVISDQHFRWVPLESGNKDQRYYSGNFKLEDGYLTGVLSMNRGGYNAFDFREAHEEDLDDYIETFADNHATWMIDSHEIAGVEEADQTVKHKVAVEIEDHVEQAGDLLLFKPLVYGQIEKNPFETENRVFPVNFGSPYQETINYRFQIPEGTTVEELPSPMAVGLPGNAGSFVYRIQQAGNVVVVSSVLKINKVVFGAEEYAVLREFYAQLVSKQQENIVLTAAK